MLHGENPFGVPLLSKEIISDQSCTGLSAKSRIVRLHIVV